MMPRGASPSAQGTPVRCNFSSPVAYQLREKFSSKKKRIIETVHCNPSELTDFNGYFDEDVSRYLLVKIQPFKCVHLLGSQ